MTRPSALNLFARVTAGTAFFLLIAGGMVTSTGSGLAVPDWPLSYGMYMPPMVGGIFFEHGHRMVAGAVGLLTFALAFWIGRTEERAWVRKTAYATAGLIVLQALLGGLTVILKLPPQVSISHACLGQSLFCLILVLAQSTSPWYLAARSEKAGDLWKLGAGVAAAVFLQLVFGAMIRHAGTGVLPHVLWALAATVGVGLLVAKGVARTGSSALLWPSLVLAVLLPTQLILGAAAYALKNVPTFEPGFDQVSLVPTIHLGVGALILGACVLWSLRAHRVR